MVKKIEYIKLQEVLNRVLRHPLLKELDLETAVYYTIDFIGIIGLPNVYLDKNETIEINKYMGILPCKVINIDTVKNSDTGEFFRSTTDTFYKINVDNVNYDNTYKLQGNYIYTTMEKGKLDISYTTLSLDKEGFPMIPDNPVFLKALELYIKKEYFTILFDMGKINGNVYNNTLQMYGWAVGALNNEMTMPSYADMETITNLWNQVIPKLDMFENGFRDLGNKEYRRK